MKYFIYFIILISAALGIYNATKINLSAPLEGDSTVGLITVLASLCAILLMIILLVSKRIERKVKERK
ncbi:hypothetical protein [uncultured Algibacter sp.]|uniref:hypothetical protein n=1 Tax=uncultured Algibacter sp. TaxID=298659 RepID=UPI00262A1E46|nr:hypothetical protein [uncultured Algibacter sp.]